MNKKRLETTIGVDDYDDHCQTVEIYTGGDTDIMIAITMIGIGIVAVILFLVLFL